MSDEHIKQEIEDGGPAFPATSFAMPESEDVHGDFDFTGFNGMSTRTWLAGQVVSDFIQLVIQRRYMTGTRPTLRGDTVLMDQADIREANRLSLFAADDLLAQLRKDEPNA